MSISKERLEELYKKESDEYQTLGSSNSDKLSDDGRVLPFGLWRHEARTLAVKGARVKLLNELIQEALANSPIPSETTRQQP